MGIFTPSILAMICLAVKRNVVGPRVRYARKLATPPVSQVDLAARLQLVGLRIDQSAISKIEQGRRPVLDTEVVALAKALKVSAAWLLGEGDTTSKASTK
jgi:transcriptional regulator with XRE-family HTH domain